MVKGGMDVIIRAAFFLDAQVQSTASRSLMMRSEMNTPFGVMRNVPSATANFPFFRYGCAQAMQ